MNTTPEYRAELRIRAEVPGIWGSQVVNDLLDDIETLTQERDKVIEHAISLVSHLCPEHLAEAQATPFPQFCEQEAVKGCEVCLLHRAEKAETERAQIASVLDQVENRAEAAEKERDNTSQLSERLRASLREFGVHDFLCASWGEEGKIKPDDPRCTCGLRAAITGEGGE